MTAHPIRLFAMTALLASSALMPLPASANSGAGDKVWTRDSSADTTRAKEPARLVEAQNDVMAPDDEDAAPAKADRPSRSSADEDDEDTDRPGDRQGQAHQRWNQAQDGHRHGDWDRRGGDERGAGGNGWSPERRRMMAMHGRMMQMMQGQRQPAAAFHIEMGGTRMDVRCSPRETTRDCVDAALSLVNRLRESGAPAKSSSGTDGAPAAPTTPPSPGSSSGTGGSTAP